MARPVDGDIRIKAHWIIKALCLYNVIALSWSTRLVIIALHANLIKRMPIPWPGVTLYLSILLILAFSTLGLWFKKQWAYLVQLLLYVLQLFVIHKGSLKLALYLGFQYIVTFTSTKANVSIGVNLVALVFILLLLLVKKEFLFPKSSKIK